MEDITKHRKALEELMKARKAVKRKYDLIRNQKDDTERAVTETFKPIIEPIKQLVNKKKKFKKENYESSIDSLDQSLTSDNEVSINDVVQESNEAIENQDSNDDLHDTFEGEKITLVAAEQDKLYGIRQHGNGYKLGNAPIRFETDHIIVNNIKFPRTEGLFELIALKKPKNYNLSDLSNYKKILEESNVHRSSFNPNGPIKKHANSYKYNTIIAPSMLLSPANTNKKTPSKHLKKALLARKSPMSPMFFETPKKGHGLIPRYKIAERGTRKDYVFWNDPNELVDRLRLLISEQAAGNTNHTNEIHSIIEELREEGYIY